MDYYKIRVDTDNIMEFERLLLKYSTNYLVCQENMGTDNPHCHAYVETNTKQATIRNAIRKQYGAGNGSYSMKSLDEKYPIEYLAYCIKEKNYRHTLPESLIKQAKEYDFKIKKEMKEKKEARKTILQKMDEEFDLANQEIITEMDIVYKVIDYYKRNGILVRQFQMVSQVQTLLLKYDPNYTNVLCCNIQRSLRRDN